MYVYTSVLLAVWEASLFSRTKERTRAIRKYDVTAQSTSSFEHKVGLQRWGFSAQNF